MKAFKEYQHSIPIINSHLEGQYQYTLSSSKNSFIILFTEFDSHFISGDIPEDKNKLIDVIRKYITENNKEEFILFSPNQEWDDYLSTIFTYIGGVIDMRLSFTLDDAKFKEIYRTYQFKHDVKCTKVTDKLSKQPYYQTEVYKEDKLISFCRAFMEGAGCVELDVWTDKKYRYKGLAFETSLKLLQFLLENGLHPNWSCWEEKKASHMLAYKLGFSNPQKVKSFIWVSDFGQF